MRAPAPRGVIARGLGRSYGDAAQNGGGRVIETTRLAWVRDIDVQAGHVTVAAGVSLDALIRLLLPLGWFIAVSPGTRYVTVGGAIAADIHGKNHHRERSFANHVESFILLTPSGDRLTLTPQGDAEAFWATAGGMGTTGVILEATLRLLRVETSRIRVDTERTRDLEDVMARMEEGDHRYRYSVAWIDCLARGRALGRSVLTRGDHAAREELPPEERDAALAHAPGTALAAPAWVPPGLLRRSTIGIFNEAWYRRAPREERGRLEPLHGFFYPLDGIRDWNRLYGKHGFLQYQFVLPFGEEPTLARVLGRLSGARCPSFLAVLKRFGPGNGLLSFPVPGWTLALDIPAALPGLAPLLDELDEAVAEASGRVYLAKDSRLRPELLAAMYPELDRWRAIRERLDPGRALISDLARRIGLLGEPATAHQVAPRSMTVRSALSSPSPAPGP